jgi:hypothetical protein
VQVEHGRTHQLLRARHFGLSPTPPYSGRGPPRRSGAE